MILPLHAKCYGSALMMCANRNCPCYATSIRFSRNTVSSALHHVIITIFDSLPVPGTKMFMHMLLLQVTMLARWTDDTGGRVTITGDKLRFHKADKVEERVLSGEQEFKDALLDHFDICV